MQRDSLAGRTVDGMRYIDKRAGRLYLSLSGYRGVSAVARAFVRKGFLSLLGIGLLSLIPLGIWFWAAYQQGGEAFVNLMLEENTGRFFRKCPMHRTRIRCGITS